LYYYAVTKGIKQRLVKYRALVLLPVGRQLCGKKKMPPNHENTKQHKKYKTRILSLTKAKIGIPSLQII
jgi:hypothetical protein